MSEVLQPPLSQGAGYGVVVGLGVAFAIVMLSCMIFVTRALKNAFGEDNKSTETFMVANRSVGTGLTASAVISSWTFTSALLRAPTTICFFAFLAIQAKLKAPNAHTLLEIIKVQYRNIAHIVWITLALLNNIFNFTSMLVGASTAVSSLTGVDIIASTYLLPLGVVVYTYWGGLRATFLTDYIHTFIMIVLVWFTIKIIVMNEIGNISALYDAILKLSASGPVECNYHGSYLSMTSKESLFSCIIHITTNFGIVIMDTGFWQKGFSADVAAAVPGYILGGNAYFVIPFAFGTIVGLGALALEQTPAFPTWPRLMTQAVSGGLVLPYTASAVAGKGGAAAILLILFMACTSVASAQLIAVSSIISFDVYGTYINKSPTDKQLIRWSHIGVVGCSIFISSFATALHKGDVDLNWTIYMLGIVVCPGTFPTCFTLLWRGQSKVAAIISPIIGMLCGFAVWFGTAFEMYSEITITSTGKTLPCMYGCLTSFFVPLPITLAISLWRPQNFDWDTFLTIGRVQSEHSIGRKFNREEYFSLERVRYMKRASRNAALWGAATFVGQVLLWPLPMYGLKTIMSKGLFTAWVVVALLWLWVALIIANFLPLIDGGAVQIWAILKIIAGKQKRDDSGTSTPSEVVVEAVHVEEKS
ncbi:SSS family solute:Na+ symporter [Mytilinidion resinicola]|uniref:SSS family solute:Na+ symporter n=1 Tax=Mytilinidion resinicola TaxID=574789 RepID=A0A6A6YBC3_9PEZI|nr:SSS family solute:Na+ symporter [Mytilinidion resinicola]KAF2806136.1 SSS family solute:Na+ symporter [Mytilinidion resinicola]